MEKINTKSQESTNHKVVNLTLIIAAAYSNSILSNTSFSISIGSLLVLGVFGVGVYRFIDKFIFNNKFSFTQSKFRQYAIGCVLISILLSPLSISQGNANSNKDQHEFSIGESLGKLHASCELSKFISEKSCQNMQLNSEFIKICNSGVDNLSPSKKLEFEKLKYSEKTKIQLQDLKDKTIKNIEAAKNLPDFSYKKMCDSYKDLFDKTFIEEMNNIKIKSRYQ